MKVTRDSLTTQLYLPLPLRRSATTPTWISPQSPTLPRTRWSQRPSTRRCQTIPIMKSSLSRPTLSLRRARWSKWAISSILFTTTWPSPSLWVVLRNLRPPSPLQWILNQTRRSSTLRMLIMSRRMTWGQLTIGWILPVGSWVIKQKQSSRRKLSWILLKSNNCNRSWLLLSERKSSFRISWSESRVVKRISNTKRCSILNEVKQMLLKRQGSNLLPNSI